MAGPILIAGLLLVGWGASKVFGGKKTNGWLGMPVFEHTKPDGTKFKVGDTVKLMILDPSQKAKSEEDFRRVKDDGTEYRPFYAPVAVATVKWTGHGTFNGEKMGAGKITSIVSREMSPNPKAKPEIGDTVLFD